MMRTFSPVSPSTVLIGCNTNADLQPQKPDSFSAVVAVLVIHQNPARWEVYA